ncbi:MAG: TolC family protein, partial [Muribaculaceae bacterium]|nr:TolC family protein [Muribaculaceae bacterium]
MKKQLIIPILTVILTACSGVKNLRVPETDIPVTFSIYMSNDTACLADLKWWEFYSDPALSGLIRKTLEQNKDLLTAASKIEELRLIYGADKAALLPSLSLNAYANNETNNYSGSGTINDTEIGMKVTVGWEANLAGALSWAKKRSASNYKASVEDYRAMQMALIALTAEGYYQMAALENEIQIVERTVETRMESLRMAKIRFEGGLTPETVYQQAIVEYTSAASKLPDLKRRLNATRNALTILMGETPKDTFDLEISRLAPVDVSKLPVGIPSGLVERRPDIRASRLRLDAARANVGYN